MYHVYKQGVMLCSLNHKKIDQGPDNQKACEIIIQKGTQIDARLIGMLRHKKLVGNYAGHRRNQSPQAANINAQKQRIRLLG